METFDLGAMGFMTTTTITLIILGLSSLIAKGQVTNSIQHDETNIYFHAVDSAVSMILTKVKPEAIILEGDIDAFSSLPESIDDIRIIKRDGSKRIKKSDNTATIRVYRIRIDKGEFSTYLVILTKDGVLEHSIGGYTFVYEFISTEKLFRLIRIDRSIMIR